MEQQNIHTTNGKEIRFSAEALEMAHALIARYPEGRSKSALLPMLHLAQSELGGWLSPAVMDYVASLLKIKPIEVYEVATFYTMYNLQPVGKHLLEVCRTGPCWLRGAEDIVKHIEDKLGIKDGETTADGMFTLKTVECLGSCGTAPMLQCGGPFYENLSPAKVDVLLDKLRHAEPSSYLKDNKVDI
jgi:NADH-quinone oxidoreductase subunit E